MKSDVIYVEDVWYGFRTIQSFRTLMRYDNDKMRSYVRTYNYDESNQSYLYLNFYVTNSPQWLSIISENYLLRYAAVTQRKFANFSFSQVKYTF